MGGTQAGKARLICCEQEFLWIFLLHCLRHSQHWRALWRQVKSTTKSSYGNSQTWTKNNQIQCKTELRVFIRPGTDAFWSKIPFRASVGTWIWSPTREKKIVADSWCFSVKPTKSIESNRLCTTNQRKCIRKRCTKKAVSDNGNHYLAIRLNRSQCNWLGIGKFRTLPWQHQALDSQASGTDWYIFESSRHLPHRNCSSTLQPVQ